MLFAPTAGGVLALSWFPIKVRWHRAGNFHLGFVSTEAKLLFVALYFSCGLHMSVMVSSWLWRLLQVGGFDDVQREISNQWVSTTASPLYFVYSIFYLHATVIDILKRFPWHSNLTDIFSAVVDYFCKIRQCLNCSDNCTVSGSSFRLRLCCDIIPN